MWKILILSRKSRQIFFRKRINVIEVNSGAFHVVKMDTPQINAHKNNSQMAEKKVINIGHFYLY
jgi:hypothetical protein